MLDSHYGKGDPMRHPKFILLPEFAFLKKKKKVLKLSIWSPRTAENQKMKSDFSLATTGDDL